MRRDDTPPTPASARVVGIGFAIAAMVAAVLVVGRLVSERPPSMTWPPPGTPWALGDPIPAEAEVFRSPTEQLAVPPGSERRVQAHARNHAMFRALRAYPGAPPRVPHGLTASEFSDASCQTCHARGGYVARFTAYAPVTPHPEYRGGCLQCHAVDDGIVGIAPPDGSPESVCLQCHVPDRPALPFVESSWRAGEWPRTGQRALPGAPPMIPHDLQMRGNCTACHVGAGAVAEVRTTHPERANCRQCHLPLESAQPGGFSRPLDHGGAP